MAKASYQELAKLANEHPELVKLQDPATGYTAIHWAAKHGNEDVVKLIAGTYKADVNARTNGGYTPLHLAMQFGRVNIFELLCNVYKANRDLMDWSGNKPLDYSKQRTTVSALTYSSEYKQWIVLDSLDLPYTNTNIKKSKNNNNYHNKQHWAYTVGRAGSSVGMGIGVDMDVGEGEGGVGGASQLVTKKRTPIRYATISGGSNPLSRTQSFFITASEKRRAKKAALNSNNNIPNNNNNNNHKSVLSPMESDLIPCEILKPAVSVNNFDILRRSNNNLSTPTTSKNSKKATRKESFLRKTLRAAATGNRQGTIPNPLSPTL